MLSARAPIYIPQHHHRSSASPSEVPLPTPLPRGAAAAGRARDPPASRELRAAPAPPALSGHAVTGLAATGTIHFVPKPFYSPDLHWAFFFFLIVFKTDFMWSQNETMIVN